MSAPDLPPPTQIAAECRSIMALDRSGWSPGSIACAQARAYQGDWCPPGRQAMLKNDPRVVLTGESLARLETKERARQYIRDITEMQELHVMSEEEVAYFASERAAPFTPPRPDQVRILPVRKR